MEKNKFVKKLTQGAIFCLCCVLMVGVLLVPTQALQLDDSHLLMVGQTGTPLGNTGQTLYYNGGDGQSNYKNITIGADSFFEWSTLEYRPYYETNTRRPYYYLSFTIKEGAMVKYTSNGVQTSKTLAEGSDYIEVDRGYSIDFYFPNGATIGEPYSVMLQIYVNADEYDLGYWNGYELGYTNGNENGYNSGYNDGQEVGYTNGYNQGLIDGTENSTEKSIWQLFFDPVTAMFQVTLYSYEGISITVGGIFCTMLGILLFVAILRWFAGG